MSHHWRMIAGALRMDAYATSDLAAVVHRKTMGNPFFVKEHLKLLQETGALTFNLGTFKWVWNLNDIEQTTDATENVIDIMQQKMASLPNELSEIAYP